jgi:hypothetical protein
MCNSSSTIQVQRLNISYHQATQQVLFDVSGTSTEVQNVTATLVVTAYGKQVYQKTFDPCDPSTTVTQLCPLPSGTYSASGIQTVPSQYASMVPAIAFNIPNLDGSAQLTLSAKDSGAQVACVQSSIDNGKSISLPEIPLAAASVAGGALILSGLTAAFMGGGPGGAGHGPGFMDIMGWYQSLALNGMLSINYSPVYRSFSKNFAFSNFMISWPMMQRSIDNFRRLTGGNLTDANSQFLHNATFSYPNGGTTITKRSLLFSRDIANGTDGSQTVVKVQGIKAFVEPLLIPSQNAFMTVLLVFAIITGGIIVGILLFKLILEAFAKCGRLPQKLMTFRERYWFILAKTITTLILLFYGTWTLYCIYELTQGDSIGAKVLAGVTLGIFTAVLGWYCWKIWYIARYYRNTEGDVSGLYENKETWRNYSIFYDSYKKRYWWMFVPAIVFMFGRGLIVAIGDGHGIFQVGGQLILECVFLIILLILRPYARASSNWICIGIQVFRALSVLFLLVFVDQLAISEAAKAISGIALVAIQSAITGVLILLIAANALVGCCKKNPDRQAAKDAGKSSSLLY